MAQTVVTRVPAEVKNEAKVVGAMQDTTPGDMLALAWREYVENHREELAWEFEAATRMVRSGDAEGMAGMLGRDNEALAAEMAERTRTGSD